jgi:hypothetical protein
VGSQTESHVSEEENIYDLCAKSNSDSSDAQSVTTSPNFVVKRAKKLYFGLCFWV